MSRLKRIWHSLKSIGIKEDEPFRSRRTKEFFNIVTLIGAFTTIGQAFIWFKFDLYAGFFTLSAGLSCILSVFIHRYVSYKAARFTTLFAILTFCSISSARLGAESYAHLPAFTLFIGMFILHDIRKEWGWILFYFLILAVMFGVVESDVYKADGLPDLSAIEVRVGTLISMMVFIGIELIFFIQVSLHNEQIVNSKLRNSILDLHERDQEKDILLKEIHHRVKNNLQIISSLLRLQTHEIVDETSREKFTDAVNRIKSISNLHETMYTSENLLKVNMEDYLLTVANNLIESYGIKKDIKLEIQSDLNNMQNDAVVPIALILNEMLSNSLKHGFKNRIDCLITVSITNIGSNEFMLEYSDNGTWLEQKSKSSFGVELIHSLTDQLEGEMVKQPSVEHSSYAIRFRLREE
jgi:two-component sensor histidine kinase